MRFFVFTSKNILAFCSVSFTLDQFNFLLLRSCSFLSKEPLSKEAADLNEL